MDQCHTRDTGLYPSDPALLCYRLRKWADGKDPNEPDVDLRGIKVGDEVAFDGGGIKEVSYVNHDIDGGDVSIATNGSEYGNWYNYDGRPVYGHNPRIISYRTPPFDFQRSYDRGVRRFVRRDGSVTSELHWFKSAKNWFKSAQNFPVRDAYDNRWTASGTHYSDQRRSLIAEAPDDAQQEGQGDDQ